MRPGARRPRIQPIMLARGPPHGRWRKEGAPMRRTVLLAGILPFVSAFLGGVLAFSLVVPSPATAQSSQLQEVRASAFTLVAPDGTVLATLAPGGAGNGGNLRLYAAGADRLSL